MQRLIQQTVKNLSSLTRFRPNWTNPLPAHDGALKIDPKGCVTTPCVTRREHLFTRRAIRQKAHTTPPTTHPQQQSPKYVKVILTHTDVDVDGIGKLICYDINYQYKCQSIFILCVPCVEGGTAILLFCSFLFFTFLHNNMSRFLALKFK